MSELNFLHSNGNKVKLTTPDTLATNRTFKLPGVDGSAGQVLQTDGNGNLSWVSLPTVPNPGISMAQQWRLRVIENLSPSYVTLTDWEICDSLGSSSGFGGNMTLSGGGWTFPSTGIYQLSCVVSIQDDNTTHQFLALGYDITTNNSSYTRVSESYGSFGSGSLGHYENITCQYLLDVTDTSNVKFRVTAQDQHGGGSAARAFGSTTLNYTTLTIMRLGDT